MLCLIALFVCLGVFLKFFFFSVRVYYSKRYIQWTLVSDENFQANLDEHEDQKFENHVVADYVHMRRSYSDI